LLGNEESAVEVKVDLEFALAGSGSPSHCACLTLLEAETEAVARARKGLDSSRLTAGRSECMGKLEEGPVLVKGRDIPLACREGVLDVPIEGKTASEFAEHERTKDLAIPVLLLKDLVRGRKYREFTHLAKERLSKVAIELSENMRDHIPSASDGTGDVSDRTEVVGKPLSDGPPAA
jgi:hypothetical protein